MVSTSFGRHNKDTKLVGLKKKVMRHYVKSFVYLGKLNEGLDGLENEIQKFIQGVETKPDFKIVTMNYASEFLNGSLTRVTALMVYQMTDTD